MSSLANLPDDQLLSSLRTLVRRGNAFEADLLTYLGEIDARRLYAREGCSSMFTYCVQVLHFAEASAYKRITAARAARQYPELLEAVRRGDLHVTGAGLLAPKLKSEEGRDLIAAARGETAEAIRRLLADQAPKPDVPASIRKAVTRPAREEKSPDERREENPPTPASSAPPRVAESGGAPIEPRRERASSEALGGERYCVRFTADREFHAQIQELRALMRHQIPDGDVGKILARAVPLLLERVRKRKLGQTDKPMAAKRTDEKSRPSRHVPAAVRRAVSKRDREGCTYVSPGGRRCGAKEFLEFHHAEPWVDSRAHDVENVTLLCRAHNQYAAVRDFGERHMARFRGNWI
jgi:5-methylcytosine-specific restriction endonuclease McrA